MKKFALYFSHSWHPGDVPLNLYIWTQVASQCNLLIDLPDTNQPDPPYYINRMEELHRRSDLFLAILPFREPEVSASASAVAIREASLSCSPYSLFEIGLAERADRPRLILYDIRTGFEPPRYQPAHVRYIEKNFKELEDYLPEGDPNLTREIQTWLNWADSSLHPKNYTRSLDSFVLLPKSVIPKDQTIDEIEQALKMANYKKPELLRHSYSNDVELFRLLAGGGLLVAEFSAPEAWGIYSIAHALFVPSIRLLHTNSGSESQQPNLPWFLGGHPRGYQEDIIKWNQPELLRNTVQDHAKAMFKAASTIINYEKGKMILESRLYGKHKIFISHPFPLGKRELVDEIVRAFNGVSLTYFEYADKNQAGEDWKKRLAKELADATHFVFLFSDRYERSVTCMEELDWAMKHRDPDQIIPFFVEGRTEAHTQLRNLHHEPLMGGSAQENAAKVVQTVKDILRQKVISKANQ